MENQIEEALAQITETTWVSPKNTIDEHSIQVVRTGDGVTIYIGEQSYTFEELNVLRCFVSAIEHFADNTYYDLIDDPAVKAVYFI
jgi:hypothetical protein